MTRLSRGERQVQTRRQLLEAARELFKRDGYAATSVERIADAAGYSKGAVYSNFPDKESIFLGVLAIEGSQSLETLIRDLDNAPDIHAITELLAQWADQRSSDGNWSLTILEHAQLSRPGTQARERQAAMLLGYWTTLGDYLLGRFPAMAQDSAVVGALLHEIAYAPALTLTGAVSAGDLMRLALRGLFSAR
ncbi:TetR/AcrR family transcriptional regulator [Pseudomonas sp. TE3610]